MGQNCQGEHVCEPNEMPKSIEDLWMCPECRKVHYAMHVSDMIDRFQNERIRELMQTRVKFGQLGWSWCEPDTSSYDALNRGYE